MVMTAYSANEQGQSAKSTARYNAREAENEAIRTRNKGTEEEVKHRRGVAELQSRQRAQLGAANVDLRSGSALDVQEDAKLLGEVDSLRVRTNFSDQASALDRSSVLTNIQGSNAQRAGQLQAAGSLIQAGAAGVQASGVSSKWYDPNSAAVTTTTTGAQANTQFGNVG
jgi:hypothetical protein